VTLVHFTRRQYRARKKQGCRVATALAGEGRPPIALLPASHRGALFRPRRLRGVELPIALFEAASPLMPGDDDPDMVRARPLACSGGDFLLRLAVCHGKDLIAEGRRGALTAR
jgi:hypothetical protein